MYRDGENIMSTKQILKGMNGDESVAYATKQVNPDVVAAYPITPQTIIVEKYSEYVADGEVDSEFVAVESEHSALSSCVGAAAAGARSFTATAANGLALMWEITFIASGLRLPIIMAVANRSLGGPINIHNDHSDSMGARDSGWIQIHCENSQEVYDASLVAWRIAEHPEIMLPVMVCLDGFTLSHTMENVLTLPDEIVKEFVGEREFITVKGHMGETELRLNPDVPLSYGPVDLQDFYFEHKLHQIEAMKNAHSIIPQIEAEYAQITGRKYDFLHPYKIEDAEVAIIGLGSAMGTVRHTVDLLREEGIKAGLIKMRIFRPFPSSEIIEQLKGITAVGVLDKSLSFGAPGGPLFEEVKAALYNQSERPHIANYIHGLGGRDTSPKSIRGVFENLLEIKEKGEVVEDMIFVGARP